MFSQQHNIDLSDIFEQSNGNKVYVKVDFFFCRGVRLGIEKKMCGIFLVSISSS